MKKEYKIENKKFEFEITEIVKRKKNAFKKCKSTRNSEIENPKTGRLAQSMKLKNVNAP